jgi:hypothetical protein
VILAFFLHIRLILLIRLIPLTPLTHLMYCTPLSMPPAHIPSLRAQIHSWSLAQYIT